MKSSILCVLLLFFMQIKGQISTESFMSLKQTITNIKPETDINNKLLFICVWKSSDFESREINKEAYRVYKIYEKAKLKNGEQGTVFISLNIDDDTNNRDISVAKDGLPSDVVFSNANLTQILKNDFKVTNPQNTILFDKTGFVQFINVSKDEIFPSLRNLITR